MKRFMKVMRPWRNLGLVVIAAAGATLLLATFTHATVPPYSLTINNGPFTALPGGSADVTFTMNTSDSNSLEDSVDVCVLNSSGGTTLPDGLSAGDVFMQDDGDQETLTVSVDSSTTPDTYAIRVGACDGSVLSGMAAFTVLAPPPDYSLASDQSSVNVAPTQSFSSNVTLTPTHGFNSDVNMCAFSDQSGDPPAAGISLEGSPVVFSNGSYSHQLTMDVSNSVAPGDYNVVFGACDQTHYTDSVSVTVDPPFTVTANDSDVSSFPGHSLQASVHVASNDGWTGSVSFAETDGSSTGFTIDSLDSVSSFPADFPVTIHVPSNATTGDYTVGVVGTSSGLPQSSDNITVHVVQPAPDGDGTMSLDQTNAGVSTSGNVLQFHYATDSQGGLDNGAVTLTFPSGWSPPNPDDSSAAGYVTNSSGYSMSASGQTLTISGLNLSANDNLDITYGDPGGGGPGATAPASGGTSTFTAQEKSTSTGTLTSLNSTSLGLTAGPGTGTLTVSPTTAAVGACNLTETFTYTAATGGVSNGAIDLTVPDGWPDPSTDSTESGFVTSSTGSAGADGSDIMVSGITLAAGASMEIAYGDMAGGQNDGVCAPSDGGEYDFTAYESSSDAQSNAQLDSSPSVMVASPDGSGDLNVMPQHAGLGTSGNTLVFALTNVAMGGGELDLTVPAGWSAPSMNSGDPGYVTASCDCNVAVGGTGNRTILISGISMGTSDEVDIAYGDQGDGGPGATAPGTGTSSTFAAKEKSTADGALTSLTDTDNLFNVVSLVAPDGSGTMKVAPAVVPAGGSGITETFTYKAATGGLDNGSVQLVVPDDWDAPQTDDNTASGFVSAAGCGDNCIVSLDGQTIQVEGIQMAGGASFTITYANGDAPPQGGDETWFTSEQSSGDGQMTEFADGTEPDISAVAADGSGEVTVTPTVTVTAVSHNSLDFNYTADDGGLTNGTITIVVPAGWSAPSTKHTDPGFTTCNADGCTVSVNKQVITVSGVTVDGGNALDIVYGDQSQGSSGAKSGAAGNAVFTVSEKSWTGGTLTALSTDGTTVTVLGPPKITGFEDTSIGDGTGQLGLWEDPVEIDGSNFQSVTDIKFNKTSVDAFDTSDDGTSINTAIPDGATSGKITLVYAGGTVVSAGTFTVIVPPEVDSFTPDGGIAPAGSKPGTKILIKGSGFTGSDSASGGEVDFGDTAATSWTVNSDTLITAFVPAGASTGPIQVTNAADTGASDQDFVVLQPPSISGIDPEIGGPGMQIEIDGAGFDYGGVDPKLRPVVKFNGKVSTNVEVDSDGVILATVPTGATSGKISVTNQAGAASSDDTFTVVNPPKVASFKPALGLADDGSGDGTTVAITGSNFAGATDVFFAGSDSPIDVTSDNFAITKGGTLITLQVPQNAITGQIAVENAGGTAYSKGNFSVIVAPSDLAFYPTSGKIGGVVTIYGSGFTGTTGVLFTSDGSSGVGDTVAGKFSVKNDGQLNVTIPKHAATGPITVVNPAAPDGVASDDSFAVVIPPTVSGFSTDNQPAVVGDAVEIDGANFTYATKVAFGGVVQTNITVADDNTINTTVPPGAKTGKISVTSPAGTGTGSAAFKVIPPPVITAINPTQAGVGVQIVIKGSNFGPATNTADNISEIDIGDATDGLDFVTKVTPTAITLNVPDDATTGFVVVQTNDRGYAVSPKQFGVLHAPEIDSLSVDPPQGVIGSVVQIFGSGFTGTTKVTFGGVAAKFTVADDGTINTSVPKGAHTGVIEVTNPVDVADSDTFSVIVLPKFTGFSPTSGMTCDPLVINGSGFTGVYQITWDQDTLTLDNPDFTVVSDTEIDLNIPSDVTSNKKLTLTNIAGSVTTSSYTITGDDC